MPLLLLVAFQLQLMYICMCLCVVQPLKSVQAMVTYVPRPHNWLSWILDPMQQLLATEQREVAVSV